MKGFSSVDMNNLSQISVLPMSADQQFEIRYREKNIVDILAMYTKNIEWKNNVYQCSFLLRKENHYFFF